MGKPIDVSCGRYVSFRLPTVTGSSQLGPGIHFAASEGSGKTGLTARKGDGYEGHGRGCGCGGWRMDVS